jgi:hypothetical protein
MCDESQALFELIEMRAYISSPSLAEPRRWGRVDLDGAARLSALDCLTTYSLPVYRRTEYDSFAPILLPPMR